MARAHLVRLALWLAIFVVIAFLADSGTLLLLFRRLLPHAQGGEDASPLRYRDVLAVKGASYFLNVLNYNAAAGGIALFVHKRRKVSFLHALSTLLWLNFVDIIALMVLLSLGAVFGGRLLPPAVAGRLPWILAVGWLVVLAALVYWQLGMDFMVLGRLRDWRIFRAFHVARAGDFAVMIAARTLFIGVYVLMQWTLLPTFDVHIGLGALLVYVPLLTFVQIVPATVSGLGAVQVVLIALFMPYVSGSSMADARALLLAYSALTGVATTLIRVGIGYLFVANVSRDFVAGEAARPAARADESDFVANVSRDFVAREAARPAARADESDAEGDAPGGPKAVGRKVT